MQMGLCRKHFSKFYSIKFSGGITVLCWLFMPEMNSWTGKDLTWRCCFLFFLGGVELSCSIQLLCWMETVQINIFPWNFKVEDLNVQRKRSSIQFAIDPILWKTITAIFCCCMHASTRVKFQINLDITSHTKRFHHDKEQLTEIVKQKCLSYAKSYNYSWKVPNAWPWRVSWTFLSPTHSSL